MSVRSAETQPREPARHPTAPGVAVALALLAQVLLPFAAAIGQGCVVPNATPGATEFAAGSISEIRVQTLPPDLPGRLSWLTDRLHTRTRPGTIRHFLRFATGDTTDSLVFAESVRTLRHLDFLADASVTSAPCSSNGPSIVTVTTRDTWSVRPTIKLPNGTGTSLLGIEEGNILGTGRAARAYVRSMDGRISLGLSYRDPWFAGTNAQLLLSHNVFRDGGEWLGILQSRERSVFDKWRGELSVGQSTRLAPTPVSDTVRRAFASLLVARRVHVSPTGVTSVILGAEAQRTFLAAPLGALVVGPTTVRREFAGLDLGMSRRTALFRNTTGLLPGNRGADLPSGFEGEIVLGVGRDVASGLAMLHPSLWLGRIWRPHGGSALAGNLWASGYLSNGQWSAATARASAVLLQPARAGMWTARISADLLADPDPDIRALAGVDYAVGVFPRRGLAESALAFSAERSVRLTGTSHGYRLDAAAFLLGSARWDPAAPTDAAMYAGIPGVGLRLAPTRIGQSTIRLDFGLPLWRSSGIRGRPFLAMNFAPWIESGRRRDGQHAR
ncbi:MAG: hypothetical protein ABI877_00720 [Gemmatimonadaceae bacterium]